MTKTIYIKSYFYLTHWIEGEYIFVREIELYISLNIFLLFIESESTDNMMITKVGK